MSPSTPAAAPVSPIKITLYRWAGAWGPFKVKIPCGECALTKDVILDSLENELAGIPVELEVREWLSEWWKPLVKGGWHAPIVMVEDKVISQGHALNRGLLTQAVVECYTERSHIQGTQIFGKANCPHCHRARAAMDAAGIQYHYRDVVKNPKDLYEMIGRVLPIIGSKTPITVPQIWVGGHYVGGADQLAQFMEKNGMNHPQTELAPMQSKGRLGMA